MPNIRVFARCSMLACQLWIFPNRLKPLGDPLPSGRWQPLQSTGSTSCSSQNGSPRDAAAAHSQHPHRTNDFLHATGPRIGAGNRVKHLHAQVALRNMASIRGTIRNVEASRFARIVSSPARPRHSRTPGARIPRLLLQQMQRHGTEGFRA